ncbi:hypothetical protein THASP1DRAFT_33842, partial [Thamnocephalis sphaerospora]
VCQILPNKFIGCIGEHGTFPIERIKLTHDRQFLGSCSHDQTIRFWDVQASLDELMRDSDDEDENAAAEADDNVGATADGDNGHDDDDDSDDSDEDQEKKKKRKKRGRKKLKNVKVEKPKKKKVGSSFFAGLS